jgi:asparagine synthase (glutamine-hydrolysing)
MCGITGFIDFTKKSSEEVLVKMCESLEHRGPDAHGKNIFQETEAIIGLGHRRLAIIDLTEGGNQPMFHNSLAIVFNGEIYNYREVQHELISKGHVFKTQSDTEVILKAFEEWGKDCVRKFTGMFAFVIYDKDKNEIFAVRDRAGVKPFFYYWNDGLFLFSSELKAFHQHPQFKKVLNLDAVAAYMQFGNVPTPHCIFRNCFKLKPGHYFSVSLSDQSVHEKKYWDVYDAYNQPKLNLSFEEAKDETENVLKKAFDYRMVSDVPVGVFLSGGYDSTCVTALLQKDSSQKIKTFTIGVPDIGLNEAPHAKEIAKQLNTDHTEFTCTQKEAIELIDKLPYYYDEPFGDSSAIPTSLVCGLARNQVTVALSADGGDEVFAGYNRYDYLMKHGNLLNQIPSPLRKAAYGIMGTVTADKIPILKHKYNFHNRYEKLKSLLQDPSAENMMLSLSKQYNDKQLENLFKKNILPLDTAYKSNQLKQEYYSPLSYMMAIDYQTYLVDDILQKVDRASMSVSLEAREPFIDQHIIEWAAQLPDSYKYHKGEKKYILKEIVHKYIPKSMMDRPKMGFAIPIENWLMKDLKEKVLYYLKEDKIEHQEIFDVNAVKQLTDGFYSGKKELALKVWYLLMFQMWYEKWMN